MKKLYAPLSRVKNKIICVSENDAELIKYASNCFLATKISFINEIAAIADYFECDINNVRKGMGSDSRISPKFLYAGCGFGGSCFPKDIRELLSTSNKIGVNSKILDAVLKVNEAQKNKLSNILHGYYGNDLTNVTIAVWGGHLNLIQTI